MFVILVNYRDIRRQGKSYEHITICIAICRQQIGSTTLSKHAALRKRQYVSQ